MKYAALIVSVIFSLDLFAAESIASAEKAKSASVTVSDDATSENVNQLSTDEKDLSVHHSKNESTFVLHSKDLWEDSAADFDEIFSSESQKEILGMDAAMKVIRRQIIYRRSDQRIDQYEVFAELRDIFSETDFSTEELMTLIEDAMEIKKKYLLIFDFVIRSKYARRAADEGVRTDEVLQIASSEYIQLPKFILRKNVDREQLNEVLSDLGCGVVWKDRAKYLFVLGKYFEQKEVKTGESAKSIEVTRFPRRIRNYLRLIEEVDKFFGEAYEHLVYLIAQDFYYADVPLKKIMKIFSFSGKEWEYVVKPKDYQQI